MFATARFARWRSGSAGEVERSRASEGAFEKEERGTGPSRATRAARRSGAWEAGGQSWRRVI